MRCNLRIFWKNTSSKNEAAALRLFLIVRSVLSLKRSVRMGIGTKDISHCIARSPDCRAVGTVQEGLRLWFAKTLHELEFHPRNVLRVTPDWRLSCRKRRSSRRPVAPASRGVALRFASDAYRVVTAVQLGTRIDVLHAFQKKSLFHLRDSEMPSLNLADLQQPLRTTTLQAHFQPNRNR